MTRPAKVRPVKSWAAVHRETGKILTTYSPSTTRRQADYSCHNWWHKTGRVVRVLITPIEAPK